MLLFKILTIIGAIVSSTGFGFMVYSNKDFTIEETLRNEKIGKIVLFIGLCLMLVGVAFG